jgi:hydroxymethylpyrimidine/phosphomethylpyrimidine kinase
VVAGSDPLSGAGAVADALTAREMGAHPLVVLTAFVDQDSSGNRGWSPVSDEAFEAQLRAAWRDGRPDAIKVGMLGRAARAQQVARLVEEEGIRARPVVIDPVLAAGVDDAALADLELPAGLIALTAQLARDNPVLLTPNVHELATLLQQPRARNGGELEAAAETLRDRTGASVLAKGGHLARDTGLDVLATKTYTAHFPAVDWPATDDVHGTGCCLSTAIACRLAQRDTLEEAVRRAREVLLRKVANAVRIGRGRRQIGASRGGD